MPTEATDTGREADDAGREADEGGLRRVARVVLLDPEDRILLLHGHEPDDPGRRLVVHARRRPGGRRDS